MKCKRLLGLLERCFRMWDSEDVQLMLNILIVLKGNLPIPLAS